MHRPRPRVGLAAAVLGGCLALGGCALDSTGPTTAPGAGSRQVPPASGWRHARTLTLDTTSAGANVPDDVANYPLAVLLDAGRFDFSQARADGADIRFFDARGKALPHAIERWDRASASAAIWVRLDVVKGNSRDQRIEMRWGNPAAADVGDSKAVFRRADGFVGVWHLDEDGNTAPDG